jgi:TRAP-type uncharacterized transport system substrate-binding protein
MSQTSQIFTRRLSKSVQLLPGKLTEYLKSIPSKPVTFLLLVTAFGAAGVGIWSVYDRYLSLQTLILVAGKRDGESAQISDALMELVKKHQCRLQELPTNIIMGKLCLNFKIEVVETDGTEENLYALEGKLTKVQESTRKKIRKHKHAHLATAQADVVADQVGQSSTSSARTVATLYTDTFQLVVRNSLISQEYRKADEPTFPFSVLKGKKISVPKLGGQRISFSSIAEHNGLIENQDFKFVDTKPGDQTETDFCSGRVDAIFRVRTLGNSEIKNALQCGQLVPIHQAAAMKIQHPAFQDDATIPEGSYVGGDSPNPPKKLKTIAVKRLLLARQDVPRQAIWELTAILNEHKPELAEELAANQANLWVKPLVTQISEPGLGEVGEADSSGVSLHDGARDFYKRNQPPFYITYLGHASTFITVVSFAVALLLRAHRHIQQENKDRADEYIKTVVDLMKKAPLVELINSQKKLEEEFQMASQALREDKISQESFRTFNEAYKTTREYIEREIESAQRHKSEQYINEVMHLLDFNQTRPEVLLKQLDTILIAAKNALTEDNVFSRESFRTFIEAHNVVREALARRI